MIRLPWLAILVALILAGCATAPPPTAPPIRDWDRYRAQLSAIDHWQLDGKLGYRGPGDSGSGGIRWQQRGAAFTINLHGPLGAGSARLDGDGEQITLRQPGAEPLVSDDPEWLLWRALGWTVPVDALRYWVRGLPAPGLVVTERQFTASGALAALEQAGWNLRYSRHRAVDRFHLPGKIRAQRGAVQLTLVIHDWQLGD